MHIVHVTCAHDWNDVRIYERMAASAARDGLRVTIVCPAPAGEAPAPIPGIEVACIERPSSRARRFLAAAPAACRLAASLGADAYHLHDPELVPWAMRWPRLARRAIFDSHEDVAAGLLGRAWIPAPVRPAVAASTRIVLGALLPRVAATIAATPAIYEKLPRSNRLAVVQNFPPAGESKPRPAARERVGAYVGTLNSIRGAEVVWQAAALLSRRAITIEVAGPVRARPACADGEAQPVLLGNLDRAGVDRLLSRAAVGIVLFQPEPNHVASQPNKIFEYMAAGVPVVASDFPLWRKLVVDTGAGLVVDPRDPAAAAESIARIIDDPSSARRMSEAGVAAIRDRFSWEPEWHKLRDAYRRTAHA
jgi:glycosyltransferase involved in cell wall biosynthesis